jgi:hypothetical protein
LAETLDRINKILKRTSPQLESEEIFEKIDEREVIEVFQSLEKVLKNSFTTDQKNASMIVATIHHNLFENAVYKNNEKARLSLLFLKSKFSKLANFSDHGLGLFLYNYSKTWFKFFISLEAKARLYISWIDLQEKTMLETNFSEIVSNINKFLPDIDSNSMFDDVFNEETRNKLLELIKENNTTTIGLELQKWIYSLMHKQVMENDQKAFKEMIMVLFQYPDDDLMGFDEILHEYAKAWYRHSLRLKKWFINFSNKLNQEPYLVEKMWRGMFWSQMTSRGKTLKEVVNNWKEKNENEKEKEIINV